MQHFHELQSIVFGGLRQFFCDKQKRCFGDLQAIIYGVMSFVVCRKNYLVILWKVLLRPCTN